MNTAHRFFGTADGLDGAWVDFDDWRLGAACRMAGVPVEVFFAPAGETHRARRRREQTAKEICGICRVRDRCARYALTHREVYDVWGGLTEGERRELRKRRA